MGVPVSGSRQGWEDGRFLLEPEARCKRSQSLSAQSNEGPANSHEDYAGCLRCFTPRSHRFESDRRVAEASASTNQQVPEQRHRAGSSTDKATASPDAGIEELPNGSGLDR